MNRFLILLALLLAATPTAGWAQRVDQLPGVSTASDDHIAAIVNDNVISTSDIAARIKLSMLAAGLPDTPEIRERLLPQILRGLIDEQLQMQEAKRLDISVTKEEIDQALTRIAHDNNIQGDMKTYISDHGGSVEALVQQIRAALSWSKVVQRELRPRVDIGDDEIDAIIARMRANAGKEEYLVGEIFLAVDSPKDEDQVKQFADNLVQQLKGGASFGAVARQFSQGTGAAAGGDIGWIQEGQLAPEIDHVLTTMQVNEISDPIRSGSGYHIIGLREKRTVTFGSSSEVHINLQQAFLPFGPEVNKDTLVQDAERLRSSITSCTDLQKTLADKFPGWRWNDLGDTDINKIPPMIADKVRNLEVGQASEPLATDKGALILFICDRHVPEGNVDRNAIMNMIGTEKLELQARRLLRDLRRAAYVDIRLMNPPS